MRITKQLTIWAATVGALVVPATVNAALYTNTIMADNPKLYYRLGEVSGTTAFDSATGDGTQNATHAGSITLNQTGALTGYNPSDTAALFGGGSAWLDSTFVLNPTLAFTVEFWLKPTSIVGPLDQTILSQRNGTGTGRSIVYWNGAGQRMSSFLGGVEHSWTTSPLTVGQYTYVAFVYDGAGNYAWYTNGAPNGAGSGISPEAADGALVIGANKLFSGDFLKGTLDEFAIYTTALSGSQIAAHYVAASIPEPSAVALLGVGALVFWRRR